MDQLKDKREFQAHPDGSFYKAFSYKVIPGTGVERTGRTIDIPIVRGSRITDEGKEVFSIQGTTIETLLAICAYDVEEKNAQMPNEYNSIAVKYIELAIDALESRQRDRIKRNVLATNEK